MERKGVQETTVIKTMKNNKGKEKILEATLKVVSDYTISGTRMNLIAEEADIRQPNIHYYFKTKNELLVELQRNVSEHCFDFRRQKEPKFDAASLDNQIELFICQKLNFILEEKQYDFVEMDFWLQTRVHDDIRQSMSQGFANWRKEILERIVEPFGVDMTDREKENFCYVMISLLQGATIQYHLEEFDVKNYFDYCKTVLKGLLHVTS